MATINNYHYNKWLLQDFTYFTMSEFRCPCKKCKDRAFPSKINAKLLTYLEQMRIHFGKPCIVTCGLRCKKYNSSLKGSVKNSKHLIGLAADIYIKDVSPKAICDYWKSLNIGYCYYGTPNMGNAAHVQIGW